MSSLAAISQPIIITDTVIQTSLCAGSSIIIPFTVIDSGGTFNFGNIFTAQLSDQIGGFSNPTDIGSFLIPWTTSGFILGTIPVNSPLFGVYKVRVVGSSPATIGVECPNFVVIVNTATLATISASDSIICSGDSIILTATPFFSSHQWALNGNNIGGANTSTLLAYQSGSYTVTVADTIPCESTSEPFNLTVENCVGLEELQDRPLVDMFPNPCKEILSVSYTGDATISIINLIGQRVIHGQNFADKIKLNVTALDAGLYYVEIISDDQRITRRFVKR